MSDRTKVGRARANTILVKYRVLVHFEILKGIVITHFALRFNQIHVLALKRMTQHPFAQEASSSQTQIADPDLFNHRAIAWRALGEPNKGVADYKASIELQPVKRL